MEGEIIFLFLPPTSEQTSEMKRMEEKKAFDNLK
jgi:hypothetical protein